MHTGTHICTHIDTAASSIFFLAGTANSQSTYYAFLSLVAVRSDPSSLTTGLYYSYNSGLRWTAHGLARARTCMASSTASSPPNTTLLLSAAGDLYSSFTTFESKIKSVFDEGVQAASSGNASITHIYTDYRRDYNDGDAFNLEAYDPFLLFPVLLIMEIQFPSWPITDEEVVAKVWRFSVCPCNCAAREAQRHARGRTSSVDKNGVLGRTGLQHG